MCRPAAPLDRHPQAKFTSSVRGRRSIRNQASHATLGSLPSPKRVPPRMCKCRDLLPGPAGATWAAALVLRDRIWSGHRCAHPAGGRAGTSGCACSHRHRPVVSAAPGQHESKRQRDTPRSHEFPHRSTLPFFELVVVTNWLSYILVAPSPPPGSLTESIAIAGPRRAENYFVRQNREVVSGASFAPIPGGLRRGGEALLAPKSATGSARWNSLPFNGSAYMDYSMLVFISRAFAGARRHHRRHSRAASVFCGFECDDAALAKNSPRRGRVKRLCRSPVKRMMGARRRRR